MDEGSSDLFERVEQTPFVVQYKVHIMLGLISLVCIVLAIVLLVKSTQNTLPITITHTDNLATVAGEMVRTIVVDLAGAVKKPGLYRVQVGSRIGEVIDTAGGVRDDADLDFVAKNINLAKVVVDGNKIYIPVQSETSHNKSSTQNNDSNTSYNNSLTSENTIGGISGERAIISINSAASSELEQLAGIGPVTAKKIIANRPYMDKEELVTKKVVSQKLFDKIQHEISL